MSPSVKIMPYLYAFVYTIRVGPIDILGLCGMEEILYVFFFYNISESYFRYTNSRQRLDA